MIKNIDPVGPLPEADANNRLLLKTDRATKVQAVIPALLSLIMAIGSISDLYIRFIKRGLQRGWYGSVPLAFIGTLFIPLAVYWIIRFLYPPKLEITDEGLIYRARGRTKKIAWFALKRLSLKQLYLPKSNSHITQTVVTGGDQKFDFLPVFGVSPSDLVTYIAARQKSSGAGMPVIVEGAVPSVDMKPDYIQRPDTKPTKPRSAVFGIFGGILAVLLVVALIFAIVFMILVYDAMHR